MPINGNAHTYTDYFRRLAVYHPDIAHDVNTEVQDNEVGIQKFTKWNAEEVVTGLRTKLGFPALLLEMYEVQSAASNVYDVRFRPKGAFTILDHVKSKDFIDEERAIQATEKIVTDILTKIWEHHYKPDVDRCNTPFKDFNFNTLQITPVGPLFSNEFGWRVEFDFEFRQTINVTSWGDASDPFTANEAQWNADTW